MCLFRIDSNTKVSILYQFGVYKLFFFRCLNDFSTPVTGTVITITTTC